MNTPNNINPNGVSDGDHRVVPMQNTINPNGGNDASVEMNQVKNAGTVLADQHQVIEPTGVQYRDTAAVPQAGGAAPASASMVNTAQTGAQRVVVEDSVTHQAGEGLTAGMSPSQETPDIFDNSPQAAIKTQTADNTLINDRNVTVIPEAQVAAQALPIGVSANPDLEVLPDGSVDIHRDRD